MNRVTLVGALVLTTASVATAAELRMQWQSLGPYDRVMTTVPGDLVVIDIYFQMNLGDSLSYVGFSNVFEPSVSQVATAARLGWSDDSTNGLLGVEPQQVVFSGPVLNGPGEFMIGSQTIRLDDAGDGSPKQIMFNLGSDLRDSAGQAYTFSPFPTDIVGRFTYGAGFPNQIFCDPDPCPPDPLILNVVPPDVDCNGNYRDDSADLTAGYSPDDNENAIPDECEVPVLYVDMYATGSDYGTGWAHAYTDLRRAFNVAHGTGASVTEIWVAAGAYVPGTSRASAFQLKDDLGVYGGFAGGETIRSERDHRTNLTILSGDLTSNDGPDPESLSENSYHVVIGIEVDDTAVLDGFTVTGGNANGREYPADLGGGLYLYQASPTVVNCTFSRNVAGKGGGAYAAWCINWPYGGPYPTFVNCAFTENEADDGGGLYSRTSATRVTNSVFSGNSAASRGGAMYNWPGASSVVTNCTFYGNTAASEGGAAYVWGSTYPTFTNCSFWQNGLEPIVVAETENTTITYSDVQDEWPGVGNIDQDPRFINPDNGDFRLSSTSPCIDAGDNTVVTELTDVDGNLRLIDDPATPDSGNGQAPIVDMGAYEFLGTPIPTVSEWGLLIMTLLVLTGGTIVLRGRCGDLRGARGLGSL